MGKKDDVSDILEERELLHKQLKLLAEKSKDSCSPETLAILSEQMVKVYSALNPY